MKKINLFLLGIAFFGLCTQAINAYKLRIMSFNIRQTNTDDGPKNLWENRKDPLCKYVKEVCPDVFGMQEVTKPQLDDVLSRLPGYSFVGVGRDDGKEKGEYIPVFYRTDKFSVIKKGWFWLSETPDVPSRGWNASCRRIASWAILEDIKTKEQFFYCNTHFDHISVPARTHSAMLTKEKFKELAGNLPILFTADFNTNEKEQTYNLLCSYEYPFLDAWKVAKKKEGGPATYNGWGKAAKTEDQKIDFLFVSPSIKVKKAIIHDSAIGDGYYLSDHNALWADVKW